MFAMTVDGLARCYSIMQIDHEQARVSFTRRADHNTKTITIDGFCIPLADVDHPEKWIDRIPEIEIILEKESKES